MNLVVKSCKSDGNALQIEIVETETQRLLVAGIGARTCGAPFLSHEASVKTLLEDIVQGLNAMLSPAVAPDVEPVEVEVPVALPVRASKAPKGAA